MAKNIKKKYPRTVLKGSPFENLVQTIPDVVYEINESGKFTFVSDAVKNFGYKSSELVGTHFRAIIHPQDVSRISRNKVLPRFKGKITGSELAPKLFDERRTGERMTKNLAMRVMLKRPKKGQIPFRWVEVHSSGKWYKADKGSETVFRGSIGIMRDITNLKLAEDGLKEERDNVRKYLDIAGVMMVALDRKGNITFVNQRASQILGWPQSYLMGKNWFAEFIPAAHRAQTQKIFKMLLAGKVKASSAENPVINNLGQERIISWQNSLVYDDAKSIIGIFSSGEDITDSKRAQEAVEMFHQMTQDILGHSPFGILVVNATGSIEYVNPVMADITGDTFEQIKKTNIFQASHFSECGLSDYAENLFARKESFMMSYASITSPGGKNFVVNIYGMSLKEGKETKALLFFEDLSEIRRAGETIKIKDKAMDSSINAVVMADLDGNITYVNQTFLTMWGYRDAGEVMEHPLKDTCFNAELFKKILDDVHLNNAWVGEVTAKRKDAIRFDAWMSANMVKDDSGNPAYVLASFVDISEKKKIEAQFLQSQKMETIGRLAGGVAHDFNNLLTAMMNYAMLAKYRLKPEDPAQEDLDQIVKVSQRAASLTRQLLSFSRRQVISLKSVGINEFLLNIDKLLRRLIPENIELVVTLCQNEAYINADIGQMEQVLVNLIVNARDAMPKGGKIFALLSRLELKEKYICPHCEIEPGEYALIRVKDTGVGMSDEVKKHLFEPFFTTKEVGKGTGLGLPTVYGIIKQHRGHVEISSILNEGSEVKIYIPLLARAKVEASTVDEGAGELPRGNEDIFVVEDEPTVKDVTVKMLSRLGYKVTAASGGAQALDLARTHQGPVAALVTDMVMPQMNGKELALKFKAIYPGIKVLFVSGYTDDPTVFDSLGPGSAFLQKPFTDSLLARKLRTLLG